MFVVVPEEDSWSPPSIWLTVDLVILTLRASKLHVLLVKRGIDPFLGAQALPGGFLRDENEEILAAAHRELREEADLEGTELHLEQLGVYGAVGRDPRNRIVSVAFLAIAPGLPEPVAGADAAGASWTPVDDVLNERVELAFDHRQILVDGLERARAKLEYSSLATAFCAESFTISELQAVYEAVWDVELDQRNFYRKVQAVEGFIKKADGGPRITKGRPAQLFRVGPRTVLYPPLVRSERSGTPEGI
jgi:8-oxo-dGTP diphosphatase